MAEQEDRLLTTKDIQERCQISRGYVYLLARRGEIESFRLGKAVRFSERSLNEWLERVRVGP